MMPARAGFAWLEPLDFSNEALAELRKLKLSDDLIETLRDALELEAQAVADRRADAALGKIRKELKAIAAAADALRQLIDGTEEAGRVPPGLGGQLQQMTRATLVAGAAEKLRQLIVGCDKSTAARLADIARKDQVSQALTAHLEQLARATLVHLAAGIMLELSEGSPGYAQAMLADAAACHEPRLLVAHLERLASGCRVRADSMPEQSRRRPEGLGAVRIAADVAQAAGISVSAAASGRFRRLARVACEAVGIFDSPQRSIECLLKAQPKNPSKQ